MGKLFYLMGKSASGKDRMFRLLMTDSDLPLDRLVIYTTRPRREGEEDGREYHFIDETKLQELRDKGLIIEERTYATVAGPWTYATVADEALLLRRRSLLGIGTPESFCRLRACLGEEAVVPLFIEVDDGTRLQRALDREKRQAVPNYEEVCRRFLADAADFALEKLTAAGIDRRFDNNGDEESCRRELEEAIRSVLR